MVNFNNGKVYKLCSDVDDLIYVGATTQSLSRRLAVHRCMARCKGDLDCYRHFNNIGWDTVRIELLERVQCSNSSELREIERRYYKELKPELNMRCPKRTLEDQKEYLRQNYLNNKEKKRQYYLDNREKRLKYQKDRYMRMKELK